MTRTHEPAIAGATARMSAGTADGTARRDRHATFVEDSELERLAELAATDPEVFQKLGATVRMQVGYYVEAKRRSRHPESVAVDQGGPRSRRETR